MEESKKHEVTIKVHSEFIPEQSSLEQDRYVFAYTITITNVGNIAAQLIGRHWIVTDANLQVQEVRGLGVVGEQPLLQPGESFEYTSGCVINTPVGTIVTPRANLGQFSRPIQGVTAWIVPRFVRRNTLLT